MSKTGFQITLASLTGPNVKDPDIITLDKNLRVRVDDVDSLTGAITEFTLLIDGVDDGDGQGYTVGEILDVVSIQGAGAEFGEDFTLTLGSANLSALLNGSINIYDPSLNERVFFDDVKVLRVDTDTNTLVDELVEGVDYEIINSQLIHFPNGDPVNGTPTNSTPLSATEEYRAYAINPAKNKFNPAKIIDIDSEVVVTEVPIWDPRREHQYHVGYNVVDLELDTDPAQYTVSPDPSNVGNSSWAEAQVGTVWWDTSMRDYVPYHDNRVFGLEQRSQRWGQLAGWAENVLYQWTQSDVPPSEWDAVAAVEGSDITIDPRIRKSGTAKVDIFRRERTPVPITEVRVANEDFLPNTIVVPTAFDIRVGDRVVFTSTEELPAPLTTNTFYYVTYAAFDNNDLYLRLSLTEGGADLEIRPGALIVDVDGVAVTGNEATGLVNNFSDAGYQEVLFTATKLLSSPSGLSAGSQGSNSIINITPSSLNGGTSGSITIDYDDGGGGGIAGGDSTGLTPATTYGATITIDSLVYNVIRSGSALSTFTDVINEVNSFIGADATASIDVNGDIVIESNSVGTGSSVSISSSPPAGTTLLFDNTTNFNAYGTPVSGTAPTTYSISISIDGAAPTSISDTGNNLQTIGDIASLLDSNISGAVVSISGSSIVITSNTTGNGSSVSIVDGSPNGLVAGLGASIGGSSVGVSNVYTAQIAVDGGGIQTVEILGEEAPTFQEVITILNQEISGAEAELFNGNIRITSNSTGEISTIDIEPSPPSPGLFQSLADFDVIDTAVDGVPAETITTEINTGLGRNRIAIIGNRAQTYSELVRELSGQLPAANVELLDGNIVISAGNNTISVTNDTLFTSLSTFLRFTSIDTGEGTHQLVPAFDEQWTQLTPVVKQLIDARDRRTDGSYDATTGVFPNSIEPGDEVQVYKNGLFVDTIEVNDDGLVVVPDVRPQDFITLFKPVEPLTEEEEQFDPEVEDDGTVLVQRKEDYNFTQRNIVDQFGQTQPVYYFWVRDKLTRIGNNPSLLTAQRELTTIPTPYLVLDKLIDEDFSIDGSSLPGIPQRYTQAIVKGLAGIVNEDDRYVLRFTRDFTLRDRLTPRNYPSDLPTDFTRVGQEPLDLKNLHAEWTLLRPRQPTKIPRDLWDKITEAVIGRKLDNPTIRVPSLNRELYDFENNTQTRWGLGEGQAFVHGQLALATILHDLTSPDNDFSPINVNSFLQNNETQTEAGIIAFFDNIYNQFNVEDVNRMFFEVLLDAFSLKDKYEGIFKTSWVALTGTQLLQTEDLVNG